MNAIATVVSVQGNVFARSANGSMRKLAAGDTLLQGEIVIAAAGGHAELQMADGTRLAVNANESFQFGPETAQATAPDASEAAVLTDSRAATVIDPEQLLSDDPTAAGLTGGENSGNSFVRLLRIVEPITPLVFEYTATPAAELFEPFGEAERGANTPPSAIDDNYVMNEDGIITLTPLAGDIDPDGGALSVIDINGVALTPGVAQVIAVPNGTVNVSATGEITFTPVANFNGTVTFPYEISDGQGGTATANQIITVTPVNDAPVAVNDSYSMPEDGTPISLNPLAGDSDIDGDALSVTSINGTTLTPGVAQVIAVPNGTVNVSATGEITFTPAANFNGTVTFPYEISDGQGGTATANQIITVTPVNDAPVAVNDVANTLNGQPVTISVLGNDSDVDGDPLTVVGTSPASNGVVNINPDGSLTYVPNPGFSGTDTFTYTITDPSGASSTATVTVTVAPPVTVTVAPPANLPPVANPDSATTPVGTPVTIAVLGNDTDPENDTLTVTGASVPPAQGTVVVNSDGTVTFTPAAGFTGSATITYTISDGTNSATSTATVGVNAPANLPPVANPDSATTPVGTPVTIAVLGNDTDPENDTLTVTGASVPPAQGTVVVNSDGTVTFTPAAGFTGSATITYTISDGTNSATSTATVGVNAPANLPPVAVTDSYTMAEDGAAITLAPLTGDSDPDGGTLAITSINGTPLTPGVAQTIAVTNGTVNVSATGEITFTPAANFNGTVTFPYEISDGQGGTATANQIITVTSVNDGPTAVDDSYTMAVDGAAITLAPLTGDSDPDGGTLAITSINGTTLTPGVAQTIAVTNGTVNVSATGVVTFAPAANFNGTVTFPYEISDGQGGTATANQIITVTSVNDGPTAVDDTDAATEGGSAIAGNVMSGVGSDGNPAGHDTLGDSNTILTAASQNGIAIVVNAVGAPSPVAFTTAAGGSLILYADGSYTYTSPDDIQGSRGRVESFDYTITDENGTGESSSAVLRITVSNPIPPEGGTLVRGTDGSETLTGSDLANLLQAYDGNDTLIGGKGNDILTGGTGADTFVWNLADVGTTSAPAKDVVMDFSLADNDRLDLSDVLDTNHSLTATSEGGKLKLVIHDAATGRTTLFRKSP